MGAPIAYATFTGLDPGKFLGAEMTVVHGVAPSVCRFRQKTQSERLRDEQGTLMFTKENAVIRFPDCNVSRATFAQAGNGYVWTLNIQDRRWRWKAAPKIDGHYNQREPNGDLVKATEKTPQQLAELLFDGMGERNPDVRKLPNDGRPEVVWDKADPAAELLKLVEGVGCSIVLGLDNRARIVRLGIGRNLPVLPNAKHPSIDMTRSQKFEVVEICGGPILFQSKLKLQAVGLDVDGKVKKLDDLSFKPAANGWLSEVGLFFNNVFNEQGAVGQFPQGNDPHALSHQSVFRWYQIKEQANGGLAPPGYDADLDKVVDIKQLMPLGTNLLEDSDNPATVVAAQPAYVEGTFYTRSMDGQKVPPFTRYDGSFSINGPLGVVQFSEFVVNLDQAAGTAGPATEIYVTTSFAVKGSTGIPQRTRLSRRIRPVRGRQPATLTIAAPELQRRVIAEFDGANLVRIKDNKQEVLADAAKILNAVIRNMQAPVATDVEYAGLEPIEPDGLIRQVRFKVGGGAVSSTRASTNTEFDPTIPDFVARRKEADRQKAIDKGELLNPDVPTILDPLNVEKRFGQWIA